MNCQYNQKFIFVVNKTVITEDFDDEFGQYFNSNNVVNIYICPQIIIFQCYELPKLLISTFTVFFIPKQHKNFMFGMSQNFEVI